MEMHMDPSDSSISADHYTQAATSKIGQSRHRQGQLFPGPLRR